MLWIVISLIVVSLLLSAFISGSETAYLSVNRFKLRSLMRGGDQRARRVLKITETPEHLFSVILLINNLVNILIAALMSALFASLITENTFISVIITTLATTLIVVVFSEITPKTIANFIPDRWAIVTSRIIYTLVLYIKPVTWVLAIIPRGLLSLFNVTSHPHQSKITPAELRMLIDIGEEDGSVDTEQGEMLERIFRLSERQVDDIMTPRNEIEWAKSTDTVQHFLDKYAKSPHTRFPVLDAKKDDVVGVVSAKNVLRHIATNKKYNLSIKRFMRDPLFILESKPLFSLFDAMRQSGNRLALVVDEFGSVSGLVTMTRLVEQVFGYTADDYQKNAVSVSKVGTGGFLVDGGMSIEDAQYELDIQIPEGDYETVAGWFLDLSQTIPKQGASVTADGVKLTIYSVSGTKINRILVIKGDSPKGGAKDK